MIITQTMIKEAFLPRDTIVVLMKVFPLSNYAAHPLIAAKREDGMNMIRH